MKRRGLRITSRYSRGDSCILLTHPLKRVTYMGAFSYWSYLLG
jgi:hypothetical protein